MTAWIMALLLHLQPVQFPCLLYTSITETRITAAKEMLEQGDLKVYEIAEKLGYESAFYFSKVDVYKRQ